MSRSKNAHVNPALKSLYTGSLSSNDYNLNLSQLYTICFLNIYNPCHPLNSSIDIKPIGKSRSSERLFESSHLRTHVPNILFSNSSIRFWNYNPTNRRCFHSTHVPDGPSISLPSTHKHFFSCP